MAVSELTLPRASQYQVTGILAVLRISLYRVVSHRLSRSTASQAPTSRSVEAKIALHDRVSDYPQRRTASQAPASRSIEAKIALHD